MNLHCAGDTRSIIEAPLHSSLFSESLSEQKDMDCRFHVINMRKIICAVSTQLQKYTRVIANVYVYLTGKN